MAPRLVVSVTRPTLNLGILKQAQQQALNQIGDQIVKDLENLETDWQHKSPFEITVSGDTVSVSTDDMIFHYLNEGTDKNYAVMTPGFVAKTTVGSLAPNRGWQGGFAYLTKPLSSRYGIEARGWTQLLGDQYEQSGQLYNIVSNTLNNAFMVIIYGIAGMVAQHILINTSKRKP